MFSRLGISEIYFYENIEISIKATFNSVIGWGYRSLTDISIPSFNNY